MIWLYATDNNNNKTLRVPRVEWLARRIICNIVGLAVYIYTYYIYIYIYYTIYTYLHIIYTRYRHNDVCGGDDTRLLRIRHATDFRTDFLSLSLFARPSVRPSHRVSDNNTNTPYRETRVYLYRGHIYIYGTMHFLYLRHFIYYNNILIDARPAPAATVLQQS